MKSDAILQLLFFLATCPPHIQLLKILATWPPHIQLVLLHFRTRLCKIRIAPCTSQKIIFFTVVVIFASATKAGPYLFSINFTHLCFFFLLLFSRFLRQSKLRSAINNFLFSKRSVGRTDISNFLPNERKPALRAATISASPTASPKDSHRNSATPK